MTGLYAQEGSSEYQIDTITGEKENAEALGRELAEKIK